MKRFRLLFAISAILFASMLSSCSKGAAKAKIESPNDLNAPGCILGVPQGTAAMFAVERGYGKSKIQYFQSLADGYTAVKYGKIDAFAFDTHTLEYIVKKNPELAILPGKVADEAIVVGAPLKNSELIKEVDAFIKAYRKDGSYKEMYQRWIRSEKPQEPKIAAPANPSRNLRIGTEGFNEPMNFYLPDGSLSGFDIEFIKRLALALNAKVEIAAMSYDALIPAVESGKIDLLIANLNATDERRKSICLSDAYIDSEVAFLVRKDRIGEKAQETSLARFSGKRIASLTGAVFDKFVNAVIPNVENTYFNDYPSMIEAVRGGKVEALAVDDPVGRMISGQCPDLKFFPAHVADDRYGFAVRKGDPLAADATRVIRDLQESGAMKEIAGRWLSGKPELMKIPSFPPGDGSKGVLRFGHDTETMPMSYCGENKSSLGMDVELAARIAAKLNRKLELAPMPFGSLIAALNSGKVDMVGGCMSITEERKKNVDFTDAYYEGGIALLVKGVNAPAPKIEKPIDLSGGKLEVFSGKRIASLTGAVFDKFVNAVIPNVENTYFNDYPSMIEAVRGGKVEALAVDDPVGRMISGQCPDLKFFPAHVASDRYGFAVRKGDPLAADATRVIRDLLGDGGMKEIAGRWLSGKPELMKLPAIPQGNGSGGVLRFGHDTETMPMSYCGENKSSLGMDVELAARIAAKLNRKLELAPMPFGSLIAALNSGKVDMVGGCMSITEERKKNVDFTDAYYEGGIALLVKGPDASASKAEKVEDFAGKKVGVLSGTKFDQLLKQKYPDALPEYFMNNGDQALALRSGKIAAYVQDEPVARYAMALDKELSYLPDFLCKDSYALIINSGKDELRREINQAIAEMKKDGSIQELQRKWFSRYESEKAMPPFPSDGPNGVIRAATTPDQPPFCYLREGKPVGYELELIVRIAEKLGMKLELAMPETQGLMMSVSAGRSDVGFGCISITEERKKSMLFSDPHYYGGVVLVTCASAPDAAVKRAPFTERFWTGFKKSFASTFIVESRYKLILSGLGVTLLISLASAFFGTLLGFLVCKMRRSQSWLLLMPSKTFILAIQGTPIVVLLMILYYIVFGSFDVNAIAIAIIGFSLNFAAYVSEMMRTGIDAVDKGQVEAALAMGFTRRRAFLEIVFPQAAKHVLPVYKGEFISMLKSTSIVGYIAIQDLTKMSDIIRSRTYEAFFPLIATAAIYFAIAYAMALLLDYIAMRVDPKRRKRIVKGVVIK